MTTNHTRVPSSTKRVYRQEHHHVVEMDGGEGTEEKDKQLDTLKYSLYYDRFTALTFQSIAFAISFIIVGQFMAFNLDFRMGGIVTVISICAIIVYIIFNIVENSYLDSGQVRKLKTTIKVHSIIMFLILAINIPFLTWAAVLMFQRGNVP